MFGNIYDVGIYMGDNKVIRASSGGVQVEELDAQKAADLSLVARPLWSAPEGGAAAPDQQHMVALPDDDADADPGTIGILPPCPAHDLNRSSTGTR